MDYDTSAIAASYDAARGYRPDVLQQWLAIIAAHAPADRELIVDVGCGTGRFSHPLSERLQARVIGIDPSVRMLAVARAKAPRGRVEFRQRCLRRFGVHVDGAASPARSAGRGTRVPSSFA
jgi:ubiquinone/menaquinone biosynthesis C-methylase UbiE